MQRIFDFQGLRYLVTLCLLCFCLGLSAQTGAYYHLINGSFNKFEDATAQVNMLKQKGYDPVVLFPSGDSKYYRVSIYHSTDRSEVNQFAAQAKKAGKPTGWVLTLTDPSAASVAATEQSRSTARVAAKPTAAAEPGNYHLIVGSFKEFDQADALVMSLAQQGYEPYVIFPQGEEKSFRVSVYNSQDRGEIEAYSSMMKKRGKEKGWIYEEQEPAPNTLASNFRTRGNGANVEKYHLIGGSFQRYDQATAFAKEAQQDGHSPVVLFPNLTKSNRYRVSIYSSNKKNEVNRYRKQLEKSGKAAGWIYEKAD